jgi:PAS domain S-box-containing protein
VPDLPLVGPSSVVSRLTPVAMTVVATGVLVAAGFAIRGAVAAATAGAAIALAGAVGWLGVRRWRRVETELLAQIAMLTAENQKLVHRRAEFVRAMNDIAYRHVIATDEVVWTGATEHLLAAVPAGQRGRIDGWFTLLHPEDRPVFTAAMQRLETSDARLFEQEYRLRTTDGTYRWFHDRGVVRRDPDGHPVEVVGLLRDVTGSVSLRIALAEEQARLQATFDQTALGIAEGTISGRLTRVNPRYCQILGRSEEEILNRAFGSFTHPDDRAAENNHLAVLQSGGPVSYSREKRYLRPDGSTVWVAITVSLVRPLPGREPFFSAILEDVTARRVAEREAAESRTRLARYAETLTLAIEAERSRIAREIHDALGQALTSLKMDIAWVRRRLARDIDVAASAPVTDRLESMGRFIDDTIVVARRLASELRPAILDSLGLPAALRAHGIDFARRTEIVFDCDVSDVRLAHPTATALYRIALEACTNVARHAQARNSWLTLRAEGNEAVLEIRDDGIGFLPGDLPGAGMGLVGITERAMLAGGHARIESSPGAGTRIVVRVPLAAPDTAVTDGEAA